MSSGILPDICSGILSEILSAKYSDILQYLTFLQACVRAMRPQSDLELTIVIGFGSARSQADLQLAIGFGSVCAHTEFPSPCVRKMATRWHKEERKMGRRKVRKKREKEEEARRRKKKGRKERVAPR